MWGPYKIIKHGVQTIKPLLVMKIHWFITSKSPNARTLDITLEVQKKEHLILAISKLPNMHQEKCSGWRNKQLTKQVFQVPYVIVMLHRRYHIDTGVGPQVEK
jgi:hypothetical protein